MIYNNFGTIGYPAKGVFDDALSDVLPDDYRYSSLADALCYELDRLKSFEGMSEKLSIGNFKAITDRSDLNYEVLKTSIESKHLASNIDDISYQLEEDMDYEGIKYLSSMEAKNTVVSYMTNSIYSGIKLGQNHGSKKELAEIDNVEKASVVILDDEAEYTTYSEYAEDDENLKSKFRIQDLGDKMELANQLIYCLKLLKELSISNGYNIFEMVIAGVRTNWNSVHMLSNYEVSKLDGNGNRVGVFTTVDRTSRTGIWAARLEECSFQSNKNSITSRVLSIFRRLCYLCDIKLDEAESNDFDFKWIDSLMSTYMPENFRYLEMLGDTSNSMLSPTALLSYGRNVNSLDSQFGYNNQIVPCIFSFISYYQLNEYKLEPDYIENMPNSEIILLDNRRSNLSVRFIVYVLSKVMGYDLSSRVVWDSNYSNHDDFSIFNILYKELAEDFIYTDNVGDSMFLSCQCVAGVDVIRLTKDTISWCFNLALGNIPNTMYLSRTGLLVWNVPNDVGLSNFNYATVEEVCRSVECFPKGTTKGI